jgi:hypothetical protein
VKELRVGIRHIEKRKLEDQAAEGRDQVRSGFISHFFFNGKGTRAAVWLSEKRKKPSPAISTNHIRLTYVRIILVLKDLGGFLQFTALEE